MELEVTGKVFHWRGPSPFHFMAVPAGPSAALHDIAGEVSYGWGMIPVRARICDTGWTTSLFPKDGGYLLPLRDAVRRAAGIQVGDEVTARVAVAVRGTAGRR